MITVGQKYALRTKQVKVIRHYSLPLLMLRLEKVMKNQVLIHRRKSYRVSLDFFFLQLPSSTRTIDKAATLALLPFHIEVLKLSLYKE